MAAHLFRAWMMRSSGGEEQHSISQLLVPNATKAVDAETVGGFSSAASLLDFSGIDRHHARNGADDHSSAGACAPGWETKSGPHVRLAVSDNTEDRGQESGGNPSPRPFVFCLGFAQTKTTPALPPTAQSLPWQSGTRY